MTSPRVAVVNEEFVKKFFPNANPLGRRFGLGKEKPADIEIVGVARKSLYNSVKEKETPTLAYIPYTQNLDGLGRVFFELRAAGDPLALVPAVRRIVHDASPNVPVAEVKTQAAQIDETISQERIFARVVQWVCGAGSGDRLRGLVRDHGLRGDAADQRDRDPDGVGSDARADCVDGAARGAGGGSGGRGGGLGRGVGHYAIRGIVFIWNEAA